MNLSDNLKKIRKENNLSQEELAEKLGVSRQSVSKWESGTSYPEMDKLLQIAKIFNVNIDELLNQDIKEVNQEKQSKMLLNKYVEDFLGFITKSIDMFSSMKFKEKYKCFLEQIIIASILTIIFLIIGSITKNIFSNMFSFLPWKVFNVLSSIFESIYMIMALVLSFILIVHIFKIRYLDYYEIVKEQDEEQIDVVIEEKENKKIYLEKRPEKIIIRDPKHSEYKFISSLLKGLLIFVKFITLIIALVLCVNLMVFVLLFVLSFLIAKSGILFYGILLIYLSIIIVDLIIIIILFNFILNKKSKKLILFITFIISLFICGTGVGLTGVGFTDFNYISDINNNVYLEDNYVIPMEEDLVIDNYNYHVKYMIENRNDIRINFKHAKYFELDQYKHNNYLYLDTKTVNDNFMIFVRGIIDDINNKKIIDYGNYEIVIYTNEENVDKLKQNTADYFNDNY